MGGSQFATGYPPLDICDGIDYNGGMMNKYTVWVKVTDYYACEVEAEDEAAAMTIAQDNPDLWGEAYDNEVDAWDAEAR